MNSIISLILRICLLFQLFMSHLWSHYYIVLSLTSRLSLVRLVIWDLFWVVNIYFHSVVWLIHLLLSCSHIFNFDLSEVFSTLHSWVVSWWVYLSYCLCIHLLTFIIEIRLGRVDIGCPWIHFDPWLTMLT